MSRVLDAAIAHMAGLKGATVEVPEWTVPGPEGAPVPVVLHFDAPTAVQLTSIEARAKGAPQRRWSFAVIELARDAEGNRVFDDDAPTLAAFDGRLDPRVVMRVAVAILNHGRGVGFAFLYALAARFGRTVGEVCALPMAELEGWHAFLAAERQNPPR